MQQNQELQASATVFLLWPPAWSVRRKMSDAESRVKFTTTLRSVSPCLDENWQAGRTSLDFDYGGTRFEPGGPSNFDGVRGQRPSGAVPSASSRNPRVTRICSAMQSQCQELQRTSGIEVDYHATVVIAMCLRKFPHACTACCRKPAQRRQTLWNLSRRRFN